ncbi:hypothetical protein E4U42_005554 [Claviceps africana]|uniref:Uncharacterized protein n=1 Tax=Claviceps africana TaxID=83212 RepID=A0A8K0NKG5_9HYPO|nr:hypothetical protein E4U42_005554 [Claviceps africana]
MATLSGEEQRAVWHETERNFWQRFDDENGFHHAKSEARYRTQAADMEDQLADFTKRRAQLADRQELLSKELTLVQEQLARVAEACDNKVAELYTLEQDYRRAEQQNLERRGQIATKMKNFFHDKGGLPYRDASSSSRPERQGFHDIVKNEPRRVFPDRDAIHAQALQQANEVAESTPPSFSAKPYMSAPEFQRRHALAHVVDCDGHAIGPVEDVEPWNHWVETMRQVPVKRQVKIRRGRKFTQNHLATIYDRSEPKGVKWIACMIQATGQLQQQRCHCCDKNQGVFDDCVILGGPLFQKCGNCEWNRQGCHRSMTTKTPSPNAQSGIGRPQVLGFREPPPPPLALGRRPFRSTDGPCASHETADDLEPFQLPTPKEHGFSNQWHPYNHHQHQNHQDHHHQQQQQRQQQQQQRQQQQEQEQEQEQQEQEQQEQEQEQEHQQHQRYSAPSGFTPANAHSRPCEMPTPTSNSAELTPRPPTAQAEITKSNLVLRHNGVVYTYPECVAGVPLAKIDQDHPYWDPRWPSIQSIIAPQLEEWKVKHQKALVEKAKGEGGSKKEQTLRQVNRGNLVLDFLDQGEISPYQLLSKRYTRTGKGNITAYDTVFRMCKTLLELANFRLDMSPVEWLRHRLHEIIVEDGPDFNYARTMHDFYHDPKFAALRVKNGFRSIGRPSGFRAGQGSGKRAKKRANAKSMTNATRRNKVHPQTPTPQTTPSASGSPISLQEDYAPSPISNNGNELPPAAESAPYMAVLGGLQTLIPVSAPLNDEFYTDGFTDTDSRSGAPLARLDWRVYQVKTRLSTSHTDVTQYWHWKEDRRVFEHQVLRDTKAVMGDLLRAPVDFDIPLDEIIQVDWNIDALQVHLVMSSFGSSKMSNRDGKPRGDVMASFKRETTMRRFLSYCRQRRLKLSKITADDMEQRWAAMQSETLPMADDEASSAFRE